MCHLKSRIVALMIIICLCLCPAVVEKINDLSFFLSEFTSAELALIKNIIIIIIIITFISRKQTY